METKSMVKEWSEAYDLYMYELRACLNALENRKLNEEGRKKVFREARENMNALDHIQALNYVELIASLNYIDAMEGMK